MNSKDPFDGLPNRARLSFARFEEGDPHPSAGPVQLSIDAPPAKRIVVDLEYSEAGWGFGHFTFVQTPDGLFLDTERTKLERVKAAFCSLVDAAITDHEDESPEDHAKYNAAMRRTCGPRCDLCSAQARASEGNKP